LGHPFYSRQYEFNEAISAVPLQLDSNVLLFALAVSCSAQFCAASCRLNASRTESHQPERRKRGNLGQPFPEQAAVRDGLPANRPGLFLLIGTGLLLRGIPDWSTRI